MNLITLLSSPFYLRVNQLNMQGKLKKKIAGTTSSLKPTTLHHLAGSGVYSFDWDNW